MDHSTLSVTEEPSGLSDRPVAPHLFLVLEAHRPLASPARFRLDGLDEITLGRGRARAFEQSRRGPVQSLSIRVDDPWMSTRHARIHRILRRWVIEDEGSKNGCLVNGVARPQAELADGDIVEIGHTMFCFREAEWNPGDPAIADAATIEAPAAGLTTLLPSLSLAFARLAQVAASPITVLLQGPTGAGKEVLARAVHTLSGRQGDFVAVNCGALPRDLVEGELFGHRRGAFSGATEDRPGLVRAADRGTLFLDEIGDLPLPAQAALLRVLQENEVRPVGSARAQHVDVRVVAATHRPLDQMVERGEFRADLLNRIAGHRVDSPPLRARREDLGILVASLLKRLAPDLAPPLRIQPRAARALLFHAWPGNVRELEKALGTALVLCRGSESLNLDHLPEAVQRALLADGQKEEEARREEIIALLRQHGGNIAAVARDMGKARMQIQRWLKRYGIDASQYRA
ncbi:Hydrogenase-4 transcriptional activator [Minicystis rosea]|nr:Hydrogenase-4 transcriptional activator [Minicystis rosea]